MHFVRRFALLFAVCVLAIVPLAEGQRPSIPSIQPYQGPPGARALGLGGAFIAVADDATAAESNPAGLVILTRPEVSLHLIRETAEPDGCADCDSSSSTRPSFASYVQPMGPAVFSVYYLSGLDSSATFTGEFGEDEFTVESEAQLRRLGVAAGFRPFPMLSIGASVGFNKLTSEGRTAAVFQGTDASGAPTNAFVEFEDSSDVDENAITYNVGVLFNPAGRVSVGALYKKGSEYDGTSLFRFRECESCTLEQLRARPYQEFEGEVGIEAPSLLGAGVAVRPFPRALLAVDYTLQQSQAVTFSTNDQEIQALRIGAEYVFATANPNLFIPLRVGYVQEKDSDFENSDFFREDADSYTVGAGLVMGQNQIDIAYLSGYSIPTNDKIRQIIISGIRRF